jgi:foldase protein PrsA
MTIGKTASDHRYQALKQQAVDFLISSEWLIGEAVRQRLTVSDQDVRRRLADKQADSFPGGGAEFHDFLKATGQTLADIQFQARAELASSRLIEMTKDAGVVTQTQIASYYERHKRRFAVPELREVRITNRKTKAAADELMREVRLGANFMTKSEKELVTFSSDVSADRRTPLERAIHAARPNVLAGPFKQRVDYFVFEVKRVVPASLRTLAQVEGSIRNKLARGRRRRALAEFVKAWRARWRAQTDCSPGYVVQKCSQYNGPMVPEDPLEFK